MKKIEREFLEEFERSLGDTTTFEDVEKRLAPEIEPQAVKPSCRRRLGILSAAMAAVILIAAIVPTALALARSRPTVPSGGAEAPSDTGGLPAIGDANPPSDDLEAGSGEGSMGDPYDNATVELLRTTDCLFFEELVFAEGKRNHVFVLRAGEIAEHYSYSKQVYRDDSFDSVKNMSMVEAVETIGIPSYAGRSGELSLDYSFNDGHIRRVELVREDGELTVSGVEVLNKEDPSTWLDPEKTPLPTAEACAAITVGMSLDEVVRRIGKPQRDVASGAIDFQFDVEGGMVLTVRLEADAEEENKYVHDNPNSHIYGSHCLYVREVSFPSDPLPDVKDWGKI